MNKIHPDEIRELAKLAKYWADKAYTLEVKLEALESERDSLKQQLAKAKCECDEWRSRCESLESTWLSAQVEAAAMRQVLEAIFKNTKAREGKE